VENQEEELTSNHQRKERGPGKKPGVLESPDKNKL